MTGAAPPGPDRPARRHRAFDEVISHVRGLISTGEVVAGDRLPSERALAEQLSVSRNTVREAFRMLEISGVITTRRGVKGGAFINRTVSGELSAGLADGLSLTDFSLEDLTESMRGLCGVVLGVAGHRLTGPDLDALEELLDRAQGLPGARDRQERITVLLDFYAVLAGATGNPVLVVLMNSLLDILRRVVPLLATTSHEFVISARRRVLRQLRAGEVEAARRELDDYLVRLHDRWLSENGLALRGEIIRKVVPDGTRATRP